MAERLQKVLAAAGIASRRDIESWIRAGRVTVNDRPATIGQSVDEGERIAIDGRRVRFERAAPAELVLIYHRPPGELLQTGGAGEEGAAAATVERLPSVRGRRWLPLSPLAPTDGGLEIFTTDGTLRAAASRAGAGPLVLSYAIRVNGEPTEDLMQGLIPAAAALERPFEIASVRAAGGEGRNRWYEFDTRGARGRDLRELLLANGLEVSRIMRTAFGPVTMDRAISRGRHRELTHEERAALYVAVGLKPPGTRPPRPGAPLGGSNAAAGNQNAGPSRPRSRGRAGTGRSR